MFFMLYGDPEEVTKKDVNLAKNMLKAICKKEQDWNKEIGVLEADQKDVDKTLQTVERAVAKGSRSSDHREAWRKAEQISKTGDQTLDKANARLKELSKTIKTMGDLKRALKKALEDYEASLSQTEESAAAGSDRSRPSKTGKQLKRSDLQILFQDFEPPIGILKAALRNLKKGFEKLATAVGMLEAADQQSR